MKKQDRDRQTYFTIHHILSKITDIKRASCFHIIYNINLHSSITTLLSYSKVFSKEERERGDERKKKKIRHFLTFSRAEEGW